MQFSKRKLYHGSNFIICIVKHAFCALKSVFSTCAWTFYLLLNFFMQLVQFYDMTE